MENPRGNDDRDRAANRKKSPPVASSFLSDIAATTPSGNSDCAFPMRLHEMINWIERNFPRSSSPVYWLSHGRAFVIQDPEALATRILPYFFNQSKIESFTRKLNRWGFSVIKAGPDKGAYMHKDFVRWEEPQSITSMSKNKKRKIKSDAVKTDATLNEDENEHKKAAICNQSGETYQKKSTKSSFEHVSIKPSLRKRNFDVMESMKQDAMPQRVRGTENETYQYEGKIKHGAPVEMNPNNATSSRCRNTELKDQAAIPAKTDFLGNLGERSFYRNTRIDFSECSYDYDAGSPDSLFVQEARSHRQCFPFQQTMDFQLAQPEYFETLSCDDSKISSSNANISTIVQPESTTSINSWMSNPDNTKTEENAMLTNVAMQTRDGGCGHSNTNNRKSHGDSSMESATSFGVMTKDLLSPLAIFSPTSDKGVTHGRSSIGEFATSTAEQKSCINNGAVEDVDEEEMDRDLRAYFAELDETIRKEQEKDAEND